MIDEDEPFRLEEATIGELHRLGRVGQRQSGDVQPRRGDPRIDARFPESKEQNRLDTRNRRSHHQQRVTNQPVTKYAPGAVSEGSEGGRSASEGASREGKSRHDSSPNVDYRIICTRGPAPRPPL
jgi:hypothetical protein